MAKTSTKNQWKAWLYLLPTLVLLGVFTVWPIINTVRMSLLEGYNGLAMIRGETFEFGFANFVDVATYAGFINCLGNTLLLCVITVPISTMLALLIAVALNSIKFIRKGMQTIFFLPYVTNSIAIGMVFMAMFSMVGGSATNAPDSVGIINNIIKAFGGKPINWVNGKISGYDPSERWANMAVLIIYIVWNALPFKILVLLGGLQGVNKQYYDAAKIDGTSRFRTFWRITVPLLSPMIAYVVITGFIGGFKEYSSVVGIFGNNMGPAHTNFRTNMNTMVGYIYDSLKDNNQGQASAAALILFAIIFVVTMINLYVSKKKVHY
ncbi:MAG: sugar ABC transporter permease [Clostridiales bacterium]|nr:sugar ABC transporter permease [Clostridiales bacterium]MDE6617561.1 sugar ABC transporter permease [Clostridiales bacterium]